MTYRVVVTPRAKLDLQELYDWIASRSVEGANRWADAFEDAVRRLDDDPQAYGLAPESDAHPEAIRQFLFKTRHGRTYRGLFFVRDKTVFLVHVRGPGQRVMRPEEIEGTES